MSRLIFATGGWYLKNEHGDAPLGQRIAELQEARTALEPQFAGCCPPSRAIASSERRQALFAAGAPEKLAERLSLLEVGELMPDIALMAKTAMADIVDAAKAFFGVSEAFRIPRIEDAAHSIATVRLLRGAGAVARVGHDRRGKARHRGGGAGRLRQRRRPGGRLARGRRRSGSVASASVSRR